VALRVEVMGIINVTPDSFFPDSRTAAAEAAIERGLSHLEAGADVLDVGGESTRPGADPVDTDEELARVIPVVAELARHGRVSIDTQKSDVALAAVAAGASIVNDVSAELAELAGELGAAYVGMHRQGDARSMQRDPHYADVVGEVESFLARVAERARGAGVTEMWLDPGIGFGKTLEHNLSLIAATRRLATSAAANGAGYLVGTSRKSFLGRLSTETLDVEDRLEGSIATEAYCVLEGATMIRAHDVASAVQLRELVSRPIEEVSR
jgi:dihydropteroate synthase